MASFVKLSIAALLLAAGLAGCALPPSRQVAKTPDEIALEKEQECNSREQLPGAYSCAMQAHLAKMRAERKAWKKNRPTSWTKELTDYFKLQLQNEDGYIDPMGLIKANRQREEMFAVKAEIRRSNPRATFADAGITSKASWQFIGPKNIGGRTRALLFVKQKDGSTALYAGTATGGIWKSLDYGKTWSPPPEKYLMSGLPISTLAADPLPDPVTGHVTLYAGTGEQANNSTVDMATLFQGSGILRSTNEGATWEKIAKTNPQGGSNSEWNFVNKIAISPTTASDGQFIRLAATSAGIRKQKLNFSATPPDEDWLPVKFGPSCDSHLGKPVGDIKFNPGDPSKVVASGLQHNVIFYSADGGNNWSCTSLAKEEDGRIELAYARTISKPDASLPDNATSVLYAAINSKNGTIYRSVDDGNTWQFKSNPGHFLAGNGQSQGGYDNAIWVDPKDHNYLLIGGIYLYRSTDGGRTFTQVPWQETFFRYLSNSYHADIHLITESPLYGVGNNSEIFLATDGGVYVVLDVAKVIGAPAEDYKTRISQMESRNQGLSVTQFYSGAGRTYADGSVRIVGGTQDNYTLLFSPDDNNSLWYPILTGDGTSAALQRQQDGSVFASPFKGNDLSRIKLGKYDKASDEIPIQKQTRISPRNVAGLPVAPFLLDPNNDERLYLGKSYLYVSNDINQHKIIYAGNDIVDDGWKTLDFNVSAISAISIAKGNPNLVWIARSSLLQKSTNALQATATFREIVNPDKFKFIHNILIDENDQNRVFVGLGSYGKSNLQRSINGGNSFQSISGIVPGKKLPDAPVRTIARHPNNPNWLYVGTGVGVYTTENAYATQTKSDDKCTSLDTTLENKDPALEGCGVIWAINDGPSNVDVHQLFWLEDGRLGAATHGRGMWLAKINAFTAPSTVTITDDGKTTLSASFTIDEAYRDPSKNEIKLFVAALLGSDLYFKGKANGVDYWDKFDGSFIPYYETRQITVTDKHLFQIVPIVEGLDLSPIKGTEVYVGYASCKSESLLRKTVTDSQGISQEIAGVALNGDCWKDMLKEGRLEPRQFGRVFTVQ